jgi:adhesin transport system outer membrane protein
LRGLNVVFLSSIQRFLILVCFGFFSLTVVAENHESGNALSVDDALILALDSHPLILSAEAQYRAAKSDLSVARWSRFPTVGASGQESTTDTRQESTTATMPLWLGGRINAEIDLAKSQRDSSSYGISEAKQTVMLEAVGLFFDHLKAEKKLHIADDNVIQHQRLFDIIERRVKASTSPDVDNMLALARLQYAKSAQIQAKSSLDISRSSLELLVRQPVAAVQGVSHAQPLDLSLQQTVSLGLQVSPRVSRIAAEATGLDAGIKSAKSALYPQVSLGYEKRYGELLNGQVEEESFVSVQFTPGAGLSVASSISAAKQRKQSALDNLEAEKRQLRRQINATWSEYTAASFQLAPSKELVRATSSVVDSYLRQYAVGKKSWLDVLNAQRESTQAKNTLVDYEMFYLTSLYRLRILINQINPKLLGE